MYLACSPNCMRSVVHCPIIASGYCPILLYFPGTLSVVCLHICIIVYVYLYNCIVYLYLCIESVVHCPIVSSGYCPILLHCRSTLSVVYLHICIIVFVYLYICIIVFVYLSVVHCPIVTSGYCPILLHCRSTLPNCPRVKQGNQASASICTFYLQSLSSSGSRQLSLDAGIWHI